MSMSVKDWLIRKLAPKMMLSEKTIEAVVNHQFQEAIKASGKYNSLEISGFGKFYFNHKKAAKQMKKWKEIKAAYEKRLQDETLTEQRRRVVGIMLGAVTQSIEDLKPKIDDSIFSDLRGVEEQPAPSREAEEGDSQDEQTTTGHL